METYNIFIMSVKDRLKKFIKDRGMSVASFEKSINASNGYVNSISKSIGVDKMESIIEKYSILDIEWLLTGKGSMLKLDSKQNVEVVGEGLIEDAVQQKKGIIRYYDVDASASPIEMFSSGSDVAYKDLIVPGFEDCEIALNIWGDSMEPKLCKGEMIICKLWQESFIEYGFVYLIETKTGHRMIKYLQAGQSPDTINCVSENKFYQPFEVKRNDILKLYVVKGHLERSML